MVIFCKTNTYSMYTYTNKPHSYNPSSSSLIPSNACAGSEALKDEDDDLSIRTRFDLFRAGVIVPSSSVSTLTLTLRDRESSPALRVLVLARLSERFKGALFGGGRGA